MTKIYACLLGEWVCLNDDPECKFPDYGKTPYSWWREGAPIHTTALSQEIEKDADSDEEIPQFKKSFYCQNYVNIVYFGKKYRVNPIFLQIVDE